MPPAGTDNSSASHALRGVSRAPRSVRIAGWVTLAIIMVTIVMGAVVRATHSGDGCGQSWPTCEGTLVLPGTGDRAQLIEFSHRAISGVSLIAMVGLVVMVFRALPTPHPARRASLWALGLLIIEALIGAMIVLYGWVADDTSVARQVSVPLHLVNTFLLTAAVMLTLWFIEGGARPQLRVNRVQARRLGGLALLFMLIAATGATTSLADTLFAAESLAEGIAMDFDREAELIVQLRILHPIVAIFAGGLLAWFAWKHLDEAERLGQPWPPRIILGGVAVQVMLGFMHIALLTPLATGLVHLALAQGLWLALAWLAFTLLSPRVAR